MNVFPQLTAAEAMFSEHRTEMKQLQNELIDMSTQLKTLKTIAKNKLKEAQIGSEDYCPEDVELKNFVPTTNLRFHQRELHCD